MRKTYDQCAMEDKIANLLYLLTLLEIQQSASTIGMKVSPQQAGQILTECHEGKLASISGIVFIPIKPY